MTAQAGNILTTWRTKLGEMAWWKFLPVLMLMTYAAKLLVILPCSLLTDLDETMDPGRAERLGWVFAAVIAPLLETLTTQSLIVWVVQKITRGSFWWPIAASALFFGAMHYFSWVYVLCMTLVGAVWAFAYVSRLECKGFASAFWLTFIVHAINNLMAFFV